MGNTKFRKLISGEIRKALRKKNLNEGYAWERQPGQPLPTMEDVANAHNVNEAPDTKMQKRRSALEGQIFEILEAVRDRSMSVGEGVAEILDTFEV